MMMPAKRTREELLTQLRNLGNIGASGPHMALEAEINGMLADEIGKSILRLADVIAGSADQGARGAKWIAEYVDKFREQTAHSTDTLKESLDRFRDSMDRSSRTMSRLTLMLVILTAVSAVSTAIQVMLAWSSR